MHKHTCTYAHTVTRTFSHIRNKVRVWKRKGRQRKTRIQEDDTNLRCMKRIYFNIDVHTVALAHHTYMYTHPYERTHKQQQQQVCPNDYTYILGEHATVRERNSVIFLFLILVTFCYVLLVCFPKSHKERHGNGKEVLFFLTSWTYCHNAY